MTAHPGNYHTTSDRVGDSEGAQSTMYDVMRISKPSFTVRHEYAQLRIVATCGEHENAEQNLQRPAFSSMIIILTSITYPHRLVSHLTVSKCTLTRTKSLTDIHLHTCLGSTKSLRV